MIDSSRVPEPTAAAEPTTPDVAAPAAEDVHDDAAHSPTGAYLFVMLMLLGFGIYFALFYYEIVIVRGA